FLHGLIAAVGLFLTTVTLFLAFAEWSGHTTQDLLLMGWFGFIFARVTAVFLIVLVIRRLWRSFSRFTASLTFIALFCFGAFSVMKSYSPEGDYGFVGEIEPMNDAPDLAPALYHKDHFFRLSHGDMKDFFGDVPLYYGRYEKTPDGWIAIEGWGGPDPLVWR